MGTRALDGPLFLRDADFDRDLAWKAELLAERHDEVFAALDTPAVRAAVRRDPRGSPAPTTTSDCTRSTPRDAACRRTCACSCCATARRTSTRRRCVSRRTGGSPTSSASRLTDVHGPVPHYGDELAAKVDGFLAASRPAAWCGGATGASTTTPTYFLPSLRRTAAMPACRTISTCAASAKSCAASTRRNTVLFTIRTQQVPLAALADRPDVARRLAAVIDGWSDELRRLQGRSRRRSPRVIGLPPDGSEELPITSLLSQVLIALTIETDNEFEAARPALHERPRRPWPWPGVWLARTRRTPTSCASSATTASSCDELAAKAGYPPPVHPCYHGMRRWGYVTYTPDIAGSTPKKQDADAIVRCTPDGQGRRATRGRRVVDEMATRWAERGLDSLQAALIPIVDDIERPLPEFMPSVSWDRRQPELLATVEPSGDRPRPARRCSSQCCSR